MIQHSLSFTSEARYYKLGDITPDTRELWFVLHGYGQLAQYFIQKFKALETRGICVIAPEALSRFYLEDVGSRMQSGNNRVGATWMTKENRDMDIANYLNFLDTLYNREVGGKNIRITLLGFSQGAATVSRWAAHGNVVFDRLILWAGIFPPDMDFENGKRILKDKETLLVYGTADPFINDSRFAEMKLIAEKLDIKPIVLTFDGKHDIDSGTLLTIA